jgi:hypothetical protein
MHHSRYKPNTIYNMIYRTKLPAAVRVLYALALARKPCTAAEIGTASLQYITDPRLLRHRPAIRNVNLTKRYLRYLRGRGLVACIVNKAGKLANHRPSYLYSMTDEGMRWLREKVYQVDYP